jgi:hypothetical protein
MKITITLMMAALAVSTSGCGYVTVSSGNGTNAATTNAAAKPANTASTSTASTSASSDLPSEIKVGEDVYKKLPTSNAKLNAGVMEKYFKGLDADKVRMEFYGTGDKSSPVMIGTYASADAAKEAMSSMDKDADDYVWTKGNLLFVTDNPAFQNKF